MGLNADFLNSVGRREVHARGLAEVSEVCPVEHEIVIHRATAIDIHGGARARVRHLLWSADVGDAGKDSRQ